MSVKVQIAEQSFDVGDELASLLKIAGETAGGVGAFVGTVRGGDGLLALTLEHYPAMTQRVLTELAEKAAQRFNLLACTVIHRVGRLEVGEQIVLVLTAAAHRAEALDATGFLIDRLKTEAPFWKLESFEAGHDEWVKPRAADDSAAARWS
ncbi:MAG: molybdenum cofactor biosynthesis protein MoaE [Acetobacter sp.]|nr:molybdenum cofactor biosynthesis protein MoaE [Acetobacter sp.]